MLHFALKIIDIVPLVCVCVVCFGFFGINMSPDFKMLDIPIFSSSLLLFGGLTLLGVNDKHIKCTQLTF